VKRGWVRYVLSLWLAVWSLGALGEVAVPALQAHVTDLTNTLSAAQQTTLEQRLAAFEARKGSQIAILLVPTTQPETIEQFSLRVVESWKLGRKGADDGVLVLVAKNDRSLRIEVGYGLEGAVPDAVAKRIVSEIITPQFKQGRFYEGLQAGTERLVAVIEGESLPPLPKTAPAQDGGNDWWGMVFIAAVIGGGMLRAIFGVLLGALIAAAIAGGVVWIMVGTLGFAALAAFIVFVMTLVGGASGRMGGGWSGGSSGGGGFSGGGGSFGGGGASGRW